MRLEFSAEDEAFRREVANWMRAHLTGKFECLRQEAGGGSFDDTLVAERKAWERELAAGKWTCVGWPEAVGGRGLSINRQVIFHEEYARAGGPGRMGHIGEGLIGPTLIAFGSEAQKNRFLRRIVAGTEFWCQGYSEPGAGSDLANVQTRARRDSSSGEWIVDGQKVWTSLAHESDWIFALVRSEAGSSGSRGLSFLLIPLDQPGIEIRPIRQLTGTAEFNEVFFNGARTAAENIVGEPGGGWMIAMGLLSFERGVSTLGQQMLFARELELVAKTAKDNGAARNSAIRQRIARSWMELKVMRYNALRTLSRSQDAMLAKEALMYKYYWSNWHRELGKLAMDVLGPDGDIVSGDPARARLQRLFLFSRADTIYAGTNEIQLNIISERALGMPREWRPERKMNDRK